MSPVTLTTPRTLDLVAQAFAKSRCLDDTLFLHVTINQFPNYRLSAGVIHAFTIRHCSHCPPFFPSLCRKAPPSSLSCRTSVTPSPRSITPSPPPSSAPSVPSPHRTGVTPPPSPIPVVSAVASSGGPSRLGASVCP